MRARTERRAAARADKKTRAKISAEMARIGLSARLHAINEVVTGSAMFWSILKSRIAAMETFSEVRSIERVRAAAMKVLAELRVDTAGCQLKLTWRPPQLFIMAVPTVESAAEVARAVTA